jgi:hypothetical protein
MNKSISAYVAVVLMLGVAVLVAIGQQVTNPDRVNAVAHRIADFDLPPGYQTDYVLDVGDYTFAAYKSRDEQSHLAFVEVPAGIIPDDEVIEGHVYGGWSRDSQRRATVLTTEERTVRSHPATFTISERVNGEGRLYRSAYLVFEGHDGTAVLVINQPAAEWDADAVDSFITSIQ